MTDPSASIIVIPTVVEMPQRIPAYKRHAQARKKHRPFPAIFLVPLSLTIFLSKTPPCQARSTFLSSSYSFWGLYNLRGGSSSSAVPADLSTGQTPLPPLVAGQNNANDSQLFSNPSSSFANNNNNNNNSATTLNSKVSSSNSSNANANGNTNTNTTTVVPEWKRRLPEPLCNKQARTFQRIRVPYSDQAAEIYLLGTAHVSNDSSRDVRLLLQTLQPSVIFVELCDQRTNMLEAQPVDICNNQTTSFWQKVTEIQLQTNNSRFQSMATVLLTQTQEEYANSLGVELGGEFRVAYQYWQSFSDGSQRPHLILGDRPLAITLARAWESLSWWGKIKVLVGLIVSTLHKPKPEELRKWIQSILDDETDLLSSSLEDLRKHFPTLERVIIRERDAYMACKLYQLCRGLLVSGASRKRSMITGQQQEPIVIVALVGAGHVSGICEWLTTKSHPQSPEDLLSNLISTKKFAHEDLSHLIFDVTELQDQL